jgi:hypothetical protein
LALSQFDPSLPLDALERPDWQVSAWMRNGDPPALVGMLEVAVASLFSDLSPAIGPQRRKNIPTVHDRHE